MSYQGKKNIYLCDECGRGVVTIDIDHGTTPFMFQCPTDDCGGRAHSLCYAAPQPLLKDVKPWLEWYKPTNEELATMSPATRSHVEMGGLISRRPGCAAS